MDQTGIYKWFITASIILKVYVYLMPAATLQ